MGTHVPKSVSQSALALKQRNAPTMSKDELRSMVREWTATFKECGLTPEKTLVAVKELVAEEITPAIKGYVDADPDDHRPHPLLADASQWCIDAYFNWRSAPRRVSPESSRPSASPPQE